MNTQDIVKKETGLAIAQANYCSFAQLRDDPISLKSIPKKLGIYVVVRMRKDVPIFIDHPNLCNNICSACPVDKLSQRWVKDAHVVYVGKAGGKKGLHQRIKQFVRHGQGEVINHKGGRSIWQIEECWSLTIGWVERIEPHVEESRAIWHFKDMHNGMNPFSNIQTPQRILL